jgi:dTDP-4-dehydrorhamnose 3,5-epimerase
MTLESIGGAYRDRITTQSYGAGRRIDGVEVIDLTVFSDEGGDFCEVTRFAPDGTLTLYPGYRPAQISYSFMEDGAIKAWHLHERQDDLWFVPPHRRVLVGLLDLRDASPTCGESMRLAMGTRARLLYIPRGVAHGIANLSGGPAALLYFVNTAFDAANPDEHRLPYDLLGAEFWSIKPG